MQAEVAQLEAFLWKDHFNSSGYEGGWQTLQLRSLNGELANNFVKSPGDYQTQNFQDTPLLAQCPYLSEVLDFFKITKTAVRLMRLDAGAVIKPHRDEDLNFEQGEVRLHIPVSTNPGLAFYLEEERLCMAEGSCWYLNLALPHRVRNGGDTPRVHLVLDGIVNDWLRAYFRQAQHTCVLLPDPPAGRQYSLQDQRSIIAQLRQLQTATADKLADEMQAALVAAGH